MRTGDRNWSNRAEKPKKQFQECPSQSLDTKIFPDFFSALFYVLNQHLHLKIVCDYVTKTKKKHLDTWLGQMD